MPLDAEARARGRRTRALRAKLAKPVRTFSPDQAPAEPRTLDDAVSLAARVSRAVLVGELDAKTCDVAIKALREFRFRLEKRDLARELRELRQEVRALKQGRPA